MPLLYPVDKHCALRAEPWSPERAGEAVREISRHSIEAFDSQALWPRHPLDGDEATRSGYYFGAGGVFWGVSQLSRDGWLEAPEGWFGAELARLIELNVAEQAEYDLDASRSYLFGDIALLMLSYVHGPSASLAERIWARLEAALAGPVLELMWGVPGQMLAALHMFAVTAEERWLALYRRQATRLLEAAEHVDGVGFHWRSKRRGRTHDELGAVHGFAGNVAVLLRGFSQLSAEEQERVLTAVPSTLLATVARDRGRANWPRSPGTQQPWRVYHCHGAPGIVSSLAEFPVGVSSELDAVLLEAGELVWEAGPLRKGPSLCHGTAGNGLSLLKLYRRTGDELWLQRARRFAMHALWQVERSRELFCQGRHTLWTGDIGVALFLAECVRETARFPTIDMF